jgi:hypothetical protein
VFLLEGRSERNVQSCFLEQTSNEQQTDHDSAIDSGTWVSYLRQWWNGGRSIASMIIF